MKGLTIERRHHHRRRHRRRRYRRRRHHHHHHYHSYSATRLNPLATRSTLFPVKDLFLSVSNDIFVCFDWLR